MASKICEGENDLKTLYPQIAEQWHPTLNGAVLPNAVAPHSNKKYYWHCDKGHTYDATPDKRVQGEGCPYCNNRRLLVGFNDLETMFPNLAAEWDPNKNECTPKDYTFRSMHKAHWICSVCGYEWPALIRNRVDSKYQACPKCTAKKTRRRTAKKND